MEKKKILIIAYYWPPSGGSGVQRWVKFVKYLPKYKIQPHIYTPLNPDFNIKDESLGNEIPTETIIIKRKIFEPYSIHRFFAGKKISKNANFGMSKSKSKSLNNKIALWIRGNILLPDPRRFWISPSYRFLKKYIKENQINVLITTGPPHSMHLIGRKLKRKMPGTLNWIADFRDPWSDIYYKKDLLQTVFAKKNILKMEKSVILECDNFVTVSDFMLKEFRNEHGTIGKGVVIHNGFDEEDFEKTIDLDKKGFLITHVGNLPHFSNPENLWKAISTSVSQNDELKSLLKLRFVGSVDQEVKTSLIENGLEQYCEFTGPVKHSEALSQMMISDILLLPIANVTNSKGILSGKLFEYLRSKNTIFAFAPKDGDLAKILNQLEGGHVFNFKETDTISTKIQELFKRKDVIKDRDPKREVSEYSRLRLTEKLVKLLK